MKKEEYAVYRFSLFLWKVVPPLLVVFGVLGNALVIVVLTRKRNRNSTTSVFLTALAASDLVVLLAGLVRQWIKFMFGLDVRNDLTVAGCRLNRYMVYLSTQFSSWMLVCVTMERFISSWFPHRRNIMCTPRTSIITVTAIFITLFIFNGHFFVGHEHVTTTINGTLLYLKRCVPRTPEYEHFIRFTWTWIDLCIFYLIPMLFLFIGNIMIIYKVVESKRRSRHVVGTTQTVGTTNGIRQKASGISGLTITLVLVSTVFVICITPIVVFPIGQPLWEDGASERKLANLFLLDTFSNLLMYVNSSVNFVLYFLSGSKFRKDVKKLLCKQRVTPLMDTTGQGNATQMVAVSTASSGQPWATQKPGTSIDTSKTVSRGVGLSAIAVE